MTTDPRIKLPDPGCVVRVGGGRGFIVEYWLKHSDLPQPVCNRVIISGTHCLPQPLPPANAASSREERTFEKLVSSLDGRIRDVWAECLFADPVADVAILGPVDDQNQPEQATEFSKLVHEAETVRIATPRTGKGYLLSLAGEWKPTKLEVFYSLAGKFLWTGPTIGGQSGSPILDEAGEAIGIVGIGAKAKTKHKRERVGVPEKAGPQAILTEHLPPWVLRQLDAPLSSVATQMEADKV